MLLRRQMLIAENDHLVVEKRAANFGNHGVVERFAEIDPGQLGAESSGDAAHVKCPIAHPASFTGLTRISYSSPPPIISLAPFAGRGAEGGFAR